VVKGMHFLLTRYLSRQILQNAIAISLIILIIIASARFVNYLEDVATGSLRLSFALSIMLWRMPEFLTMILPLGLLISVIITYGSLYANQEMVILHACGVSEHRIMGITLLPAGIITIIIIYFSFYLSPLGLTKVETILQKQISENKFEVLTQKKFRKLGNKKVIYAESIDKNKENIGNVFIAYQDYKENDSFIILLADNAYIDYDRENTSKVKDKFLILESGNRYDITKLSGISRSVSFEKCAVKLQFSAVFQEIDRKQALPTSVLLKSSDYQDRAELLWRISMPIVVIFMTILAFVLSKSGVRKSRFTRLPIGILAYLFYLALLVYCRNKIEKYGIEYSYTIWTVHILIGLLVAFFYFFNSIKHYFMYRKYYLWKN
jgi:lipopolysaccharide export system permease protein